MIATFSTTYKEQPHRVQAIGLFNDGDPITFCCRYDWHREISLVNQGDAVHIDGTDFTVEKLDIDLTGVASFTLVEVTA